MKLCVFLIFLCAYTAPAAILFYDDFSATGSGTGWASGSSWSSGSINDGKIVVTGSTSFRDLNTAIDTATADFWFMSRLTITQPSYSWAGISFYYGGSEDLFFGSDNASTTWEFDTVDIEDQNASVENFSGQEVLLVAHISPNQISMWLDPTDTSSQTALGTADVSFAQSLIAGYSQWTRLRIASSYPTITVNSMTAADTFTEAIPEPTSISLIGISVGVLAMIRRWSNRFK